MVRGCLKQEIKMRLIGRQRGDQEQGEGVLTQSWRLNRRPPPARAASGRNLRVESVLGFRFVVSRVSLAHANRNFDCRLGI